MSKKNTRIVVHLVWDKAHKGWYAKGPIELFITRKGETLLSFGIEELPLADTKVKAIALLSTFLKYITPSQLVIHGKNGKIQREYTYGDDPRKTKG